MFRHITRGNYDPSWDDALDLFIRKIHRDLYDERAILQLFTCDLEGIDGRLEAVHGSKNEISHLEFSAYLAKDPSPKQPRCESKFNRPRTSPNEVHGKPWIRLRLRCFRLVMTS
jgi:hypothetical protein